MRATSPAFAACLLAALLVPAPSSAQLPVLDPYEAALERAIDYLELEALDGNEYLVEALVGAGIDPGLWPTANANVLDTLSVPLPGSFNDPIREIHAVTQSGYDPHRFQGRDLVSDLRAAWDDSIQGVGQASFTLLGLHAAGVLRGDPLMEDLITQLQQSQFASGGWTCWGLPSPDCTGFALVALASEDAFLPGTAERARVWLDANRLANGGYASGGHIGSLTVAGVSMLDAEGANTQSTIWAVNGYRALGDPAPAASMAYLLGRQMPDGGFAWRDTDTTSQSWSTMEVVAGWKQSFHELPTFAPATITAPIQTPVGMPATFDAPGFTEVVWRNLATANTLIGTPVQITFPATGTATVHLDASAAGTHHREKLSTVVANTAPAFFGLPADLTVQRHDSIAFTPTAIDPDGQAVTIAWTFEGESGTGTVTATPNRRGDYTLLLVAQDSYGAQATADVLVHVVKQTP